MTNRYVAMIKRELWENRSIFVTPAAIASIVVLGVLTAIVLASTFWRELPVVIFGTTNLVDEFDRRVILSIIFGGTSSLFLVALAILTTFYCLDSLYTERRDKSILFWRSMPVTDTETVLSKLVTAVFIIPLITIAAIIATNILNLILISIWVSMKGGDAGFLIWGSAPFIDNWVAMFTAVIALSIWVSPFIAWFLFVSAFTRKWPFLVAFLPPILAMLGERIIFKSTILFSTVVLERGKVPLFSSGLTFEEFFEIFFTDGQVAKGGELIGMLAQIDLAKFFSSPGLWLGLVACGLFTTAAIYVRRFRDDS